MNDIALRSVYCGLIAVLLKDLFDKLYMTFGFSGVSMAKVAAGSFMPVDKISTPTGLIIGYTAHYTVGGILGLFFLIFLLQTNTEHNIQKGVFFGLAIWLLLAGVSLTLGVSNYYPVDPSSKLMLLFDHIIFGGTLGFLTPRLALEGNDERYPLKFLQPAFKLIDKNKSKFKD